MHCILFGYGLACASEVLIAAMIHSVFSSNFGGFTWTIIVLVFAKYDLGMLASLDDTGEIQLRSEDQKL